jgi:hypothetical protein
MNKTTLGALKRILREVEEKRQAKCHDINCVVNQIIGGNDIDLVNAWISEIEDRTYCHLCGAVEDNHFCTNETCSEFTRYED